MSNAHIKRVGHHLQRTSRLKVDFRPASTKDHLSELVGAACDVWFLKHGMKLERGFNFGKPRARP